MAVHGATRPTADRPPNGVTGLIHCWTTDFTIIKIYGNIL